MNEIVFLNGAYVERAEACISPDDRGFIFADGIYEVTKFYYGKPFRLEDHLQRLKRSLKEIDIEYERVSELETISLTLLEKNNLLNTHAGVYWQISRGAHPRVHHFPTEIKPTIYAFAFPLPSAEEKLGKGIKVIVQEDIRWKRCDIKSVSLLPNTMLYNEAVKKGAGESILVRDGYVTEATHSGLFTVKNGVLITRPLSNLILPSITRKVVLELCAENQLSVEEKLFAEAELKEMDEVFICGTGSEILPVVEVDDVRIGNGEPGPVTRKIQQLFFEAVNKL
ncbi:D-amino-acid transaminase [Maribellus sp. CM-23]|uniref:D-amino-acid transaminase n=1 Tax=Maribellus sp. CM-23 TaxID=2781026 RepID=UPI001F1F4C57|nr:D-amino-acid transaminase [Maribellus sp. CM-23]MCE4566845.1 D-amino-acid transaminase [Maribellus sp. CM-23]